MTKSFYVTTAIDYVNGHPHVGHAYEKIITDVIARSRRSMGESVFFLTGLDEHGQKVQQAAKAEGKSAQEYCDSLAEFWVGLTRSLEVSVDDFVRTSEVRHKNVVQAILNKLHREGQFYKSEYRGFYSVKQETFLTEKDRLPDGSFDPIYGEVTELAEENYYFRLREHQQWLIDFIERNPEFIYPSYRRNEVLGFLKNEQLEDMCITRPVNRLNWGIPLPFDSNFVTFVWFDALVNYVSIPACHGDPTILKALGTPELAISNPSRDLWPADIHMIGKDILKFHAVYWPIMLKAMGLPLPKRILAHGWWQKDGQKLSKTTGNVVDPLAVIKDWGLDAFRYYVVREMDIGPDGNWTDAGFAGRYEAELANGLGNLLNRSLSMLKRYRAGIVPAISNELAQQVEAWTAQTKQCYREFRLQEALVTIWSIVTRANQYVDQTAPFRLAKDPAQAKRLDEVLYNLVETCRIIAVLLWPVVPDTAARIYNQIGLARIPDKMADARWGELPAGHAIGEPSALFPRREK